MTLDDVAHYYDRNTARFLRLGGSGQAAAIHRAVWAPGITSSEEAFLFLNHWVALALLPALKTPGLPARLLDLGCGVGGTATWLAHELEATVVGLTNSPVQARLAGERARRLQLKERCQFLAADFLAAPLAVGFQGIYAIESFVHARDPMRFFDEVSRLLPHGGRLAICDDFLCEGAEALPEAQPCLNRFREGWHIKNLLTSEETIRLASQAGLRLWANKNLSPFVRNAPPYFQEMFASDYPGLDHYWREQSFDLANLTGSEATDQWYTLPHTRTYYLPGGSLDWWKAAQDCTAVGDGEIDYTNFVGINLMFNDLLDCCAWGGSWWACLDGECRWWSITWEPPWGYQNIGVIAHENGHGFGLPHSSGDYGQTYDNAWDVMSDVWSNGARGGVHPVYGVMGQHTISYHKDLLGWITDTLRVEVPVGTWATVSLEQFALPQTQDSLIAVVPIDNSPNIFYTVEARRLAGYDGYLPGNAVIIHEVQLGRDNPAHVVDIDGNGDTGDAGAMWLPGETFIDAAADIEVAVLEENASGFVVAIKNRMIELTGLVLDGPAAGSVGATIPFTATVTPPNATLPVTYTWQTPGQPPMVHVGGISDTAEFTWNVVGSYPLTVTATNPGSTFTQTQTIDIYIPPQTLELDGPTTGLSGAELAFEAAAGPISVTQPVTYLWQISGRAPVTHTGGLTDSLSIVWAEPGPQTVTLTASNPAASVTATQEVMILGPLSSLQIQGPEAGALGQVYTFTASVTPLTATQPVMYVWQVSDGRLITHTAGLSDTATFSWEMPGTYTLSVNAANAAGEVRQDFRLGIYWAPAQLEINAAARGYVGAESAYIAAVKPVTGTAPLTYVWQVDDGATITHTSGVTDTLRWTWLEPGAHTLTLVVKNVTGQVMGSLETEAYYRIVLPVVMRLMH